MANLLERRDDGTVALFINGDLQFDSNDERIYHEALALPGLAIASRRQPSQLRVLVIGGGDGLVAREFFKSDRVQSLDLVDYDPEILNIARHEIAELNESSLSDPRMTTYVQDAWAFVDQALVNNALYDVIVSDLTGAVDAMAARFHSIEWYGKLSRLIRQKGIISVNGLSPQRTPEAYWSIFNSMAKAGLHVRPFHISVPSFAARGYGQDWGFFLASAESIIANELEENLPLAGPRYFLKTIDDVRKLFVFPRELFIHQGRALPALIDSDILLEYFSNPTISETVSGDKFDSFSLDTKNMVIPEPDTGKGILPAQIKSMLAKSVYQIEENNSQDPQLLLQGVLELMPSLQRQHTPQLIADFLATPAAFLESIDLSGLVARLLKRAKELPARVVAELELLRDKLQEWAGDPGSLLALGQRVVTILTLVIVVGNLLYPDAVYGKGEGHHGGEHAAPGGRGARGDRGERGARGRRGGYGYGGGYGWTGGGTNTYYTNRKNININEHNFRQPGQMQYGQPGINRVPVNRGGPAKAPDTVGFGNFTEGTEYIASDVWLTDDGKYLAVQLSSDQLVYLDGRGWYSDQGSTAIMEPYPTQVEAALHSYLSAVVKDTVARQNRLLKNRTELVGFTDMLTRELNQYKSTTRVMVKFGSHRLPVEEAVRRTLIALKIMNGKIELLDKQIEQRPVHLDLAKIALANLNTRRS